MAEINSFPARYPELPDLKRKIVALALGRTDWLRTDGIDSLVQARDEVGLDWSRAVEAIAESLCSQRVAPQMRRAA